MPYPLPLTRTEAYLAYKAGAVQQSDLKPSLAVPRNGIDAWLAYWTGLAADYPKREDGTPHILQEEEAYIAYLSGVINEYPEKCLRRVGAYLRYLISARWGRPDHPLNREELYLSLIKTQFIPSGDPSSDIVIDGTTKAPFQDVKMYGDTYQQSFTGKNLLNLSASRDFTSGTDYSFDASSGVLTVTMSSAPAVNRYSGWRVTEITAGAKYTFSIESFTNPALSNTDRAIMIRSHNGTSASELATLNKTQTSYTFTAPNDSVRLEFFFYIASGDTDSTSIITKPMLEAGETVTSYEPFVGGQPSPSPDYPQPIQTVTGRQVVNVQGKNLFVNIPTGSNNGVDFTLNNDGTYDIDGRATAQANNAIFITDLSKLTDGSTYTLSATKALPSGVQVMFEVFNGSTWVRHALGDNGFLNNSRQSITGQLDLSGGDRLRLTLRVQNGTTVDLENFGVQLELGSTVTAYEPYSSNDYEINLGKNLYDKDANQYIYGYFESGTQITGAASGYRNGVVYLPCEPSTTYTIGAQSIPADIRAVATTKTTPEVGTAVSGEMGLGLNAITITTQSDARYIVIRYRANPGLTIADTISSFMASLQVEKGSTATPYTPYFTPIELCKIGDYQDYIYKDGNTWKVHKATSSITLDGTEAWVYAGNYNYARCPSYTFVDKPLGDTLQLSNCFGVIIDWGSFRDSTSRNAFFPLLDGGYKISIRNTDCTSAEDYTSWLSANKPSFYYPVATPTDTTITDSTLIAQLEALVNGGAENGTTYITVSATDPNLPGLLYVEAPKYE